LTFVNIEASIVSQESFIHKAAANFGKSSHADLVIGVRFEDVGTITNAGGVHILYGSTTGLSASGDQFWTQDSPGVLDTVEEGDRFGSALPGSPLKLTGFD
jgi:hypothetical protein